MTPDTTDQIRYHAEQILSLLPPATPPISEPAALDEALRTCAPGTVLVLTRDFVYPQALTLSQSVTLQSETWVADGPRMTVDEPAPTFLQGIVATGDHHALQGLALRGTNTLGVMDGHDVTWDRCRLLGDPVTGAHRGIEWRGGTGRITRCYIDDIFRPTQDCQAIAAFDCDPGLLIEDCWLSAAGQSVMFGGADSSSAARIPTGIRIHDCDLTKKPEWLGVQQVKCAIEFKCCIDVTMTGCRLAYAGTSQGQGCYLIVCTVRNQNGKAPWSCVTNIEIANCSGRDAAGLANILGTDNNYPSGRVDGFHLHDCSFTGIDGRLGQARLFMLDRSPAHVTLQNLTVEGSNLQALGYFLGKPSPTGFVAGGLTLPTSKYGWKIDGSAGGGAGHNALMAYMPDAALDATIV